MTRASEPPPASHLRLVTASDAAPTASQVIKVGPDGQATVRSTPDNDQSLHLPIVMIGPLQRYRAQVAKKLGATDYRSPPAPPSVQRPFTTSPYRGPETLAARLVAFLDTRHVVGSVPWLLPAEAGLEPVPRLAAALDRWGCRGIGEALTGQPPQGRPEEPAPEVRRQRLLKRLNANLNRHAQRLDDSHNHETRIAHTLDAANWHAVLAGYSDTPIDRRPGRIGDPISVAPLRPAQLRFDIARRDPGLFPHERNRIAVAIEVAVAHLRGEAPTSVVLSAPTPSSFGLFTRRADIFDAHSRSLDVVTVEFGTL